MKANINPLPQLFGNITPAEMERITKLYQELSVLTDSMLIRNKKARASVATTHTEK